MEDRVILHCDINHCYAQIEEMRYPKLRNVAMAVGGHEENRHGIILAKNDLAKEYGLKTGEPLREAYRKCPHLVIIHPHYEDYCYYTEKVKDIYREYSDRVESFGLDEAWIDCTESLTLFGSARKIAEEIQKRVLEEVGLTVSIGISFNKVFAKLGSDLIKPSGLVEITKENYKSKIWFLPANEMLFIGRATMPKLEILGIKTIGDIARFDVDVLKRHFGKMGEIYWWLANGCDQSEVALCGSAEDVKSIGNGVTAPRDIYNFDEAKTIFYVLCESIATRAKEKGLEGKCVRIHLRDKQLKSFVRQKKLERATNLCEEMMRAVLLLLKKNYDFSIPLRSVSVALSDLQKENEEIQMTLFQEEKKTEKAKNLEKMVDQIRSTYGANSIKRCSMLVYRDLSEFNPKEKYVAFPKGFY